MNYNIKQGEFEGDKSKVKKLNSDQVKEIRLLLKQKVKQKDLALRFNVNQSTISKINQRQTWQATKFCKYDIEIDTYSNNIDDLSFINKYYGECL
jgi:DNA invertase Pin-like site-specific DNA recombinase